MKGVFENIFSNGMSSDYDVVLQPDGTYRYMKNCQLVSQDGRNFVVKDCIGNLVTFTINPPYASFYTVVGDLPKILWMISFPNKLIVSSTNSTTGGYLEIGKLEYLPYGEGVKAEAVSGQYNSGYIPLYHDANLNVSILHKFKGFAFIENELIERIYWTDNYNKPRTFNVSDPIFTTYFATGSLVVGEQYMVLEGAITHNATNYGPGLANGNVFTAANANYTNLTGTTPTPKVIAYFPYQQLDFQPSRTLGNITFNRYGSGSLYCGSKIYYYRLVSNSGAVSSWSYGSSPVPVGALNSAESLTVPTVAYHDFVGGGTENELLNSGLSNYVTIENIDTSWDTIELACAEFDQLIDSPRLISVVVRETITGATMTLQHDGGANLKTLTIGDITLFPASILKIKTLATNKNYILAGNITERQEFDFDITANGGISAVNIPYPMNVHYDATSCSLSGMVYSGVSPVTGVNPAAGSVTPWSRWVVTVGQPIYNGVTYNVGDVILGVTGAGNDTIDFATHAGSQARPCVNKNRYTTNAAVQKPNAIQLQGTNPSNTCFWDYKSAAAHHHVAGYWGGETYRFGILFYDKQGNPYYVKWLFDYQFQSILARGGVNGLIRRDQIGNSGNYVYSLVPYILEVGNIVLPQSIIDVISGFSIVRAERDARVITSGLVTQNVHTAASPDVIRPAAFNPANDSLLALKEKSYSYICPDLLVNVPLKKEIGVPGDTMEEVTWVVPYQYNAAFFIRGQGPAGSEQVYTKFLQGLNDGTVRSGVISLFNPSVDEAASIDVGGDSFQNGNLQTSVGGCNVDGNCVTGGLDYSLASFEATGGKKAYFELESDFLAYGPSPDGYTSGAGSGGGTTSIKILMDYVKTGFANPYGGTGDGAKANTLYISTGHFQPITATVLTETSDGAGNYIFNNVQVAGGDCFVNLIDQGYALWDNTFTDTYSFAWTFPCQNNANYDLRRGRKTSNVEMYYTGTALTESIVFVPPSGDPKLEDYSYNQGYSTEGQTFVYPALPVNFINSGEFIARIRFNGPKFPGEIQDSFRTFPVLSFKDLSYNYGRINDINVKNDSVFVWQDLAIVTVPVLERQQTVSESNDVVNMGTGGVVDRFDVRSSDFGTQHQWSITETEYGFAFFDMIKKAFVIIDLSGGIIEVSQIFGEKGFFGEAFLEIEGTTSTDKTILLNSPTFADTSDRPLTGVGIISVYDPKFKMTYMTFKFFGQNSTGTKAKDFTIGYLHTNTKKCFVGFFDWFPYHVYNHNGIVLSATDPKNTTQYLTTNLTGKSFVVGETIWGGATNKQKQYVCILAVTLDNVAKLPEGASGATYWTLVNTVNQVMALNQPTSLNQAVAPDYNYNMFDGLVVNGELHVVINPKMQGDESFEVQSMSQNGPYNVNYTSVYIDADSQTASDVNISAYSRFYRFIRNKIVSTLPLSTTGRGTNAYALIRLIKKNYTTSPIVMDKGIKILRSLTTYFNTKR